MIRHSQAWSRRRIDPPHARSLIFSSPLYCIGASDHLASITAFMSDCLLLRLRLTLHDPLSPLHPSVIAIRSVCSCHFLDSCVSSFHWKQCVNKPTSHELPSLFYFSRFFPKIFLLNPLVTQKPPCPTPVICLGGLYYRLYFKQFIVQEETFTWARRV